MNENEVIVTSEQANEILEATNVPEKSGVVKKVIGYVTTAVLSAGVGVAAGWKAHKAKTEKEFNSRVEKALAEIEAKKQAQETESNNEVEEKEA